MKSILIIGMGRFGRHLANKFQALGNDVMIVDKDENIINSLSSKYTEAFAGDCTNEDVIKSLGINNFDICFVTIGDNFQSSLEITSLLKEYNANYIVSKATVDMQAKFLKQIGANEVVYPEKDMAENMAIKFNNNNVYEYIAISGDCAIFEISILKSWANRTIVDIDVRKNYNINIVAVKRGDQTFSAPGADFTFQEDDHIIIIGDEKSVKKLTKSKN